MKTNKLLLLVFLMLSALASTVSADDYVMGPFIAYGYGASKGVAAQQAYNEMEAHVNSIQASLPPEYMASAAITSSSWDGVQYQIHYKVFVNVLPPI